MRKVCLVVAVLVGAAMLSGCVKTSIVSGYDPGFAPKMDSQMNPGWGGQYPTVCYDRESSVSGREDICRVLKGYEDGSGGWPDDTRQWIIDYDGGLFDEGPLAWASWPGNPMFGEHPWFACPVGVTMDPYGCAIVTEQGAVYEGCTYSREANFYLCDYQSTWHKAMAVGGLDHINYLRATIAWSVYVFNAASCAWDLYHGQIDEQMVVDCNDGPYNGSLGAAGAPAPGTPTFEGPVDMGPSTPVETDKVLAPTGG